jgi:pimeloyl-ACP methyl ester carboxylesterase
VSARYAEDFRAAIKGSRVEVLPECGHFPMFEKRVEFVELVTDFLAQ